ncbi:MAG: hypothetical protein ABI882_20755 [Acidobacteriota bacterium]
MNNTEFGLRYTRFGRGAKDVRLKAGAHRGTGMHANVTGMPAHALARISGGGEDDNRFTHPAVFRAKGPLMAAPRF